MKLRGDPRTPRVRRHQLCEQGSGAQLVRSLTGISELNSCFGLSFLTGVPQYAGRSVAALRSRCLRGAEVVCLCSFGCSLQRRCRLTLSVEKSPARTSGVALDVFGLTGLGATVPRPNADLTPASKLHQEERC